LEGLQYILLRPWDKPPGIGVFYPDDKISSLLTSKEIIV
jgi:hypothetical protein